MDAQIAITPNNPPVGDDIKSDVGASYANALLSHKQSVTVKNNKENIMENNPEPQAQKCIPQDVKQIDSDISKMMGDDDGTFTPVINNSRKDRKVEKHRKQKHVPNGMIDKNEGHEKSEKKDSYSSKDKQKDLSSKDKKNPRDSSLGRESGENQIDTKTVFVEAPLPKTNPWQVKNTSVAAVETSAEKRVLQPQKQEVSALNSSTPSQTEVKDKKQINDKVRNTFKICIW